jgi:hypothetical protein
VPFATPASIPRKIRRGRVISDPLPASVLINPTPRPVIKIITALRIFNSIKNHGKCKNNTNKKELHDVQLFF